ncbi:CHRD domain-containing protein [Streptomyces sp. ISL-98]|uniref:CHRD domain-containing protein n=1 Tax=Streptomyces sp. ISL-98 TaxID=2819192 RepID=UPI001BECF059|nr:CHRD domain-containing protein [Streptomyces sp. ISL-98]MBT2510630.1 CHRD domain-containing protein [Streptomyces sp. ISL-98]
MRVLTTLMVSAVSCTATLAALAVPAAAASTDPDNGGRHAVVKGRADLTGRQEVPGPGDRNGSGEFWFLIKHGTLCYSLNVRKIAKANAAHIHAGKRGKAGPVVVTLKTPLSKYPKGGSSKDCIKAKKHQTPKNADKVLTFRELALIALVPKNFYVNVHNRPFPDGAIRGQLRHQ